MSDRKLRCEIVTPEQIVYEGDVDMIIAPGGAGELGILPLHAPLITTLKVGELQIKHGDNKRDYVAIDGGYLEVREDKVTVLADAAELVSKIDVEQAKRMKEEAEQRFAAAKQTGDGLEEAERTLERALNRLRLVDKRK